MKTRHRLTMEAICPVNGQTDLYMVDVYVRDRLLECEKIQEAVQAMSSVKDFQENLTQQLANKLDCKVRTEGMHCNWAVTTVCTCTPQESA